MNIYYKSNKLKRQLSSASEIKKAYGVNAKRVALRMHQISASPNLAVLKQIGAAYCHQLILNREGEWAVDISGNDRIIFEIANEPIPVDESGKIVTALVTDIRILAVGIDYH